MMEAVFFDFGGVIATPDPEEMRRLEEQYGLPKGALRQAAYEIPEWQELRFGKGIEEAWQEAMRRRLEEIAGRSLQGIVAESERVWRGRNEEVIDLARQLRRNYKVGMISNGSLDLEDVLHDHYEIDHLFDPIVNSARVGMAKPDPRIFRLAAEQMGVQPPACVHIDDIQRNVIGAREAGMHGIHYQGHLPSLVSELQRLGLQW